MRNTSMMVVVLVALGAGGMGAQQGTRTPNMKVTAEAVTSGSGQDSPGDASRAAGDLGQRDDHGLARERGGAHETSARRHERMDVYAFKPGAVCWRRPRRSHVRRSVVLGPPRSLDDQERSTPDHGRHRLHAAWRQGCEQYRPLCDGSNRHNNWIVSPPHIMIAVPNPQQLDAFTTDPHSGGPWVMWKGTPYAHLMVPTAAMAKPMTNDEANV